MSFEPTLRTTYAEIINSFTKTGVRILLSIFDYEHSEHPTIPFAGTEAEVGVLYQKYFKQLLQEFDAKQTRDALELPHDAQLIQISSLSRFSWKILLLVKQS